MPVRLGGIHALWKLAQDAPRDNVSRILDIFCAYVRHPPYAPDYPADPNYPLVHLDESENMELISEIFKRGLSVPDDVPSVSPDVQAIMSIVTDPSEQTRRIIPEGYIFDFTDAYLVRVKLNSANLTNVIFDRADLRGADLRKSILTGTSLMFANLHLTNLIKAQLSGCHVMRSDLAVAIRLETDRS